MKRHNYILFSKSYNFKVIICSIIVILIFLIFIFISLFVKFSFIDSYIGVVGKDSDYYVYILIDDNRLASLSKRYLVYDGRMVDYKITSIDDDYVLTEGGVKRYVRLSFDFDDKIINNTMKLNFLYDCTIFEYVKESIYERVRSG